MISPLLQVISRPMVGRQLTAYPGTEGPDVVTDETHLLDVTAAVTGLVKLFQVWKNDLFLLTVRHTYQFTENCMLS